MTRTVLGQPNPPETDGWSVTGTTVIQRVVEGEPQLVVVCGECEVIHKIGVPEAMRAALNDFMRWHREDRHKTTDQHEGLQSVEEK